MWLKRLHTIYVSRENFESILDTSIKIIYNKTGKKIDHNDKLLFETFNTIASQVFSIESKNPLLQKNSPEQAVQIINGIVIEELVKYILNKNPILLKEPEPVKQEPGHVEETIKISIENMNTKFTSSIENIISIKMVSLHMYTEDYLVTELNNTLIINYKNEVFVVNITPGNYTKETLLEAVTNAVSEEINIIIDLEISHINSNISISPEIITINKDLSTLNDILGIGTGNPVKLIKRNKLQLGVKFEFENENNNFEYSTPLIIGSNKEDHELKEFKLNYGKKFNRPVDLTEIDIDFDNYNHRGYPFYLMIEITRLV